MSSEMWSCQQEFNKGPLLQKDEKQRGSSEESLIALSVKRVSLLV